MFASLGMTVAMRTRVVANNTSAAESNRDHTHTCSGRLDLRKNDAAEQKTLAALCRFCCTAGVILCFNFQMPNCAAEALIPQLDGRSMIRS